MPKQVHLMVIPSVATASSFMQPGIGSAGIPSTAPTPHRRGSACPAGREPRAHARDAAGDIYPCLAT